MTKGAPENRNWNAWQNNQPPGPPRLFVTGEVETNNGAQVPVLKPAVPQGINPDILILDLTIETQGDVGTDDVAFREARYEQTIEKDQYKQVDIHWEGASIAMLDVKPVE